MLEILLVKLIAIYNRTGDLCVFLRFCEVKSAKVLGCNEG
jgi:hypothetical protein